MRNLICLVFVIKILFTSAGQLSEDTLTASYVSASYAVLDGSMDVTGSTQAGSNLYVDGNFVSDNSTCTTSMWNSNRCSHISILKNLHLGSDDTNVPFSISMRNSHGKPAPLTISAFNSLEEGVFNGGDFYLIGGQGGNLTHTGGSIYLDGGESYSPNGDGVQTYGTVYIASDSGRLRIGKSESQCTRQGGCSSELYGRTVFPELNSLTAQRFEFAANVTWSSEKIFRLKLPEIKFDMSEGDFDIIAPRELSLSTSKSSISLRNSDTIKFEMGGETLMQMDTHPARIKVSAPLVLNSPKRTTNDRRVMSDITDATSSSSFVSGLPTRHFKRPGSLTNTHGFIAQDVQSGFPSAVDTFNNDLHVQYDSIYLEMINAVKDLNAQMNMLSAEVGTVKASLAEEFKVHRHDCNSIKNVYDKHCCSSYNEDVGIGYGVHAMNSVRVTNCGAARDAYQNENCPCS